MDKLIEIAKENGGKRWKKELNEWTKDHVYINHLTDDQLRATVEQVCAPLVEALNAMNAIFDTDGDHSQSDADTARGKSRKALAAYMETMGDKE